MAFEFLKKFKKSQKSAVAQTQPEPPVKTEVKKEKAQSSFQSKFQTKSNANTLILKRPIITERASDLASQRKYVFEVAGKANKNEIKKAVQAIWQVRVAKVNIINFKPKRVRLGKTTGLKGAYKKALVTLEPGYSIELLPR